MLIHVRSTYLAVMLTSAALIHSAMPLGAQIPVRHAEGLVHGFLLLSTLDGKPLADGDLIQVSKGYRVTSQLVFRFKDGSLHGETAVFSQRGNFRLISYHLTQKGPAFHEPIDVAIEASSGQVTIHYTDDKGNDKAASEKMKLPPDVANGMVSMLLKNVVPGGPLPTMSMVATTPKPRLVKLAITAQGEEPFAVGGSRRTAMHYVLKIQIGGVSGVIAPLLGKQPPDIHVWILTGATPAFVKSEGQLYPDGPIWRIELASPVWPRTSATPSSE
jgi:hypothetical protein